MPALRYRNLAVRILAVVFALLLVTAAAGAVIISRTTPCGVAAPSPAGVEHMQAVVHRCYGGPEVLELVDTAKPTPTDDEVLVQVRAASVNPADWHGLTGLPYIVRASTGLGAPQDARFGTDYAGVVVAIGRNVTRFKPGDEVFGARSGSMAQFVAARADRAVVHKPANLSFEEAAAMPVAAITALQGLRDHGQIKRGDKVLINGASGGVGSFAVQIAKAYGAEVTGVCSTRNVDLVRSLGADHVIDYTQQDYTAGPARYDLVLDNVGNRSPLATRRVLKPEGTLVLVSGPKKDPWLGPLLRPIQAKLLSPFVSQELVFFIARLNREDLDVLVEFARAGRIRPMIDRRYPLEDAAAAVAYLGTGRARAKVIVTVDDSQQGAVAQAQPSTR